MIKDAEQTLEITVRYFTVLRLVTGKRQEILRIMENCTVESIVRVLTEKYGGDFERYVNSGVAQRGLRPVVFLNGQDIAQSNGMKTLLHDGDIVALMLPIAGG